MSPGTGLTVAAFTDDVEAVLKALHAARLLAEGYGKPTTAANMAKASEAMRRVAMENERLREEDQRE